VTTFHELVRTGLDQPVRAEILAMASALQRELRGAAVLFYGSALRTGDLDGVLDFYVLRAGKPRRSLVSWLWPDVSYHEQEIGGRIVRAKVATMPLATFERAARGKTIDTTIWTRFAQPARLLLADDAAIANRIESAVMASIVTATRFAAALGPSSGGPADYWRALFAQTYGAEFRVERQGRGNSILAADPAYYDAALRHAWVQLGLIAPEPTPVLHPLLGTTLRKRWLRHWHLRKWAGKPLNMARLVKAAWTFDGATRYALWKIERHSGVHIPVTPWRESHPILAAPGVLFRLWRAARS
jgi:hypothetical protein